MTSRSRELASWMVRNTPISLRRGIARVMAPGKSNEAAALVPDVDVDRSPRVILGPLNAAGQASAWSRAIEDHLPGAQARSVELVEASGRSPYSYAADAVVPTRLRRGRLAWEHQIFRTFTHALLDRASSITALSSGVAAAHHLADYGRAGVTAGIVVHGTEMRDHTLHAALYPHSPFRARSHVFDSLQARVELTRRIIHDSGLPTFVTTPDMLDFVPGATLVPIVIDVDRFASANRHLALERDIPVVLHAPSNPALKGTAIIEPVLERMHSAGEIEYRRIKGITNEQMPRFIGDADIVVDQIALGNVGVLAAESMAAGRVTVAHLHDRVRDGLTGDIPLVNADPATFRDVLNDVLDHRSRYADLAVQGPSWVRERHDGRHTAAALAPFLDATAAS